MQSFEEYLNESTHKETSHNDGGQKTTIIHMHKDHEDGTRQHVRFRISTPHEYQRDYGDKGTMPAASWDKAKHDVETSHSDDRYDATNTDTVRNRDKAVKDHLENHAKDIIDNNKLTNSTHSVSAEGLLKHMNTHFGKGWKSQKQSDNKHWFESMSLARQNDYYRAHPHAKAERDARKNRRAPPPPTKR